MSLFPTRPGCPPGPPLAPGRRPTTVPGRFGQLPRRWSHGAVRRCLRRNSWRIIVEAPLAWPPCWLGRIPRWRTRRHTGRQAPSPAWRRGQWALTERMGGTPRARCWQIWVNRVTGSLWSRTLPVRIPECAEPVEMPGDPELPKSPYDPFFAPGAKANDESR